MISLFRRTWVMFLCDLQKRMPFLFLLLKSSRVPQVTRLQYLNALMASRVAQSPDPPEIKILPNSQTKLLNEKNTTQGAWREHSSTRARNTPQQCVTLCALYLAL